MVSFEAFVKNNGKRYRIGRSWRLASTLLLKLPMRYLTGKKVRREMPRDTEQAASRLTKSSDRTNHKIVGGS